MLTRMPRSRGFTLVELLITLVLMGMLLLLGIPSLARQVTNSRIQKATEDLRQGFDFARMRAIQTNTPATLVVSASGWVVNDSHGVKVLGSTEAGSAVTVSSSADSVTFGVSGRTVPAGTEATLNIQPAGGDCSDAGIPCLRLIVNSGGLVRTCNPSVAEGYLAC